MKLSLLAGSLALAAATAAFAGDKDPASTFKSLDTDGNGRISETEARAHAELSAGYRDAVSDSTQGMSMAEFEAWAASQKPGAMTPQSSTPQPSETPPSN